VGVLGVSLSMTGYLVAASGLVLAVLVGVAVWNLRVADATPDGQEGV
jgi:hypothetical protein